MPDLSSNKGAGGDDPVAHLLQAVQDVHRRGGELYSPKMYRRDLLQQIFVRAESCTELYTPA